jgi:hypothetical protein
MQYANASPLFFSPPLYQASNRFGNTKYPPGIVDAGGVCHIQTAIAISLSWPEVALHAEHDRPHAFGVKRVQSTGVCANSRAANRDYRPTAGGA